jgi:hypothetical protein
VDDGDQAKFEDIVNSMIPMLTFFND